MGLVVAHPLQIVAQEEAPAPIPRQTVLRWWHGAVALGGLSAFMLLDQPLQEFVQGGRSASKDGVSGTIRRFG